MMYMIENPNNKSSIIMKTMNYITKQLATSGQVESRAFPPKERNIAEFYDANKQTTCAGLSYFHFFKR